MIKNAYKCPIFCFAVIYRKSFKIILSEIPFFFLFSTNLSPLSSKHTKFKKFVFLQIFYLLFFIEFLSFAMCFLVTICSKIFITTIFWLTFIIVYLIFHLLWMFWEERQKWLFVCKMRRNKRFCVYLLYAISLKANI